jgi:hypothetical protein
LADLSIEVASALAEDPLTFSFSCSSKMLKAMQRPGLCGSPMQKFDPSAHPYAEASKPHQQNAFLLAFYNEAIVEVFNV